MLPRLLLICLLLYSSLRPALAQDTTIVLSTSMFTDRHTIPLPALAGWVYKAGHDTAWARQNLNTAGWVKRDPGSFSATDADAAGKAEGWFRLRIRLDSTFNGLPLGVGSGSWAASEVYVNGQWAASFGSTGRAKPYAENNPTSNPPLPIRLAPGEDYLIAIHVVDEVFPFPPFAPKKLKSEISSGTEELIWLSRPAFMSRSLMYAKTLSGFVSLLFTVSLLLAFLFWLLSMQEQPEKNTIRLLAIVETLFIIVTLDLYTTIVAISFTYTYFFSALDLLVQWPIISLSMVAFLQIFGYRIPNKWIGISVLASLGVGTINVYIDLEDILSFVGYISMLLVFLYVIIASWKRLKGAQWAVVVGVVFTFLVLLVTAIALLTNAQYLLGNFFILLFLMSGTFLSLPLSFLIYLVLRFKETLAEVRTNAAAVVLVTQEKRDLLASQNERLEQQVEQRTAELKASQQQLIQKEKMASLGELTAGIAHEIQNPLNFVNNFSEVSAELVDEIRDEELKADRDAQLIGELLGDLSTNLQKITHHGGRASAIVKGMLEHSSTGTGEKRPADLNALADEYLKIAYHGLRATNKHFNAELETDFGAAVGLVEVVPQEISRVLLNLYNNAFYAVQQKQQLAPVGYQPTVRVDTTQVNGQVQIRVSDNGTGIPDAIKAKIFQPFFTTKPTGEGTGLGLSLSYDIITKGHGGSLSVESQEKEGTAFVISLPVAV